MRGWQQPDELSGKWWRRQRNDYDDFGYFDKNDGNNSHNDENDYRWADNIRVFSRTVCSMWRYWLYRMHGVFCKFSSCCF